MSFVLLNPHLEGKKVVSQKSNVNLAADEIWSDLSTKIKNYIPEFYFSIQNSKDNKIHHIRVRENLDNNKVKYNLKVLTNKKYHDNDKVLLSEIKNSSNLMDGGRRRRDRDSSSSSSSSSEEEYLYTLPKSSNYLKPTTSVINLTYYPSIYGVRNILLPTFTGSFTPYIKLNFPLLSPLSPLVIR
jgi:hypothetical protein